MLNNKILYSVGTDDNLFLYVDFSHSETYDNSKIILS